MGDGGIRPHPIAWIYRLIHVCQDHVLSFITAQGCINGAIYIFILKFAAAFGCQITKTVKLLEILPEPSPKALPLYSPCTGALHPPY